MKNTAVIVVLLLLLASSHMLLSSRTIRARMVARFGEKRFLAAYSVVALLFFVPLFHHYFTHRHLGPQLWAVPASGTVEWLLGLANAIGLVLLVAGLLLKPVPGSAAGTPREQPTGAHRITRHPLFMGVSVMALAHAVPNGHASDVAFFGGIAVFSLVSYRLQDLRKLAAGDPAYKRFHAATSFLPFTGRGGRARADGTAPARRDRRHRRRAGRALFAPVDRGLRRVRVMSARRMPIRPRFRPRVTARGDRPPAPGSGCRAPGPPAPRRSAAGGRRRDRNGRS